MSIEQFNNGFIDIDEEDFVMAEAREEFNLSELVIAQNCSYPLNDMVTKLNNNVLVVGGSGAGKTRTIVMPNIYQAVGSYVTSDPKGNLHKKDGRYLEKKGYKVKVIDFTHPENSAHYNPLKGIRRTQDILKMAAVLVDKKSSVNSHADPFWDDATTILISAIIAYMIETGYQPFNFSGILKLVREGERENDDSKSSKLSRRFERLKRINPQSWAVSQFESIDAAPNKTYDTIRISLLSKFAKFDTQELQEMMSGSDFDFASIGKEKTAVFVIVSDTDRSMDSLANIFFTQAMNSLCEYADNECEDSRLPVPVRFILDDFATNCRIEEFPRMISSIRSRGISVMLMVQSEAQLKQGYEEDGCTIISNCDTYVYLGGNDVTTANAVSMRCNKPLSRILYMPVGYCWVFRRGSQPVYTALSDAAECIREMELN